MAERAAALRGLRARMPAIPGFEVLLAAIDCESGRLAAARRRLGALCAGEFELPVDPLWLGFVALAAQVASEVSDTRAAHLLYRRLHPFEGSLAVLGGVATGTTDHFLAMLSASLGEFSAAERHFTIAVARSEEIAAPVLVAQSKLEWASMLLTRRGDGDLRRSRHLLGEVCATAPRALVRTHRRASELLHKSG